MSAVLLLTGGGLVAGDDENSWSVEVDPLRVINQHVDVTHGMRACGPAAVLNSLRCAGGEVAAVFPTLVGSDDATRLRFLIDRWFTARASSVDRSTKRFGPHGCYVEDLAAGFNELLVEKGLPRVRADYMDRRVAEGEGNGETQAEQDRDFVRRVHRNFADSLRDGVAPVVSLRSYVARKHYGESDETRWGDARHHYVVVTSVPRKLGENDLGFRFEYIDPNGGKTGSAWVYAEQHLPFRAFRGSNGIGRWLRGTPFLLVIAPSIESLQPLKVDWPDRVIITLNYAIFR